MSLIQSPTINQVMDFAWSVVYMGYLECTEIDVMWCYPLPICCLQTRCWCLILSEWYWKALKGCDWVWLSVWQVCSFGAQLGLTWYSVCWPPNTSWTCVPNATNHICGFIGVAWFFFLFFALWGSLVHVPTQALLMDLVMHICHHFYKPWQKLWQMGHHNITKSPETHGKAWVWGYSRKFLNIAH